MKLESILRPTVAILGVALMLLVSGCMSTGTESDLPWNTPANWEGSPSIPGMTPEY